MDNNYPPLRFSLTPPPAKSPHFVTSPTNNKNNNNSSDNGRLTTAGSNSNKTVRINLNNNMQSKQRASSDLQRTVVKSPNSEVEVSDDKSIVSSQSDIQDDYNQWLHAMKLVARLPGGMPPEFRRKLWLTLAEKYLKSRNVDWKKEEKKCLSEEWREDDEELGIQIVKDLHRTGSNLCSGPAAKVNQARLKRVLLGYARYNPVVGYCQGFNMLGALILQVMDKEEVESMKVMIYLVEGILPPGYFCGSMGGLQADMGVFRELMQCKLPRLARHLEKLQGPIENAYEPPLTNVFTMQWFLTMFCTCLPMTCVLRVWDLVLIEGSDVLLRTSLVLWGLLEERVLSTRSADDFYCKMGSFASELLNGHLIDSNSLIEKIVQLGPIMDIDKLRSKHLYHITPIKHKSNLPLYLGEEEPDNDEESRLAIATVWGIPWSRRGSQPAGSVKQVPTVENKDRLALDISLLKKQYDKLRERQKQAHIIITTACTTARQGTTTTNVSPSVVPVNQLLAGRPAIVTNQGRRIGPPAGVIPPARKPSLPSILQSKPAQKQLRRGETLHWRDTDLSRNRRDSLTWKEIRADRESLSKDGYSTRLQSQKLRSRVGKSDSSSYSEESDDDPGSSTDTSLCDDDPQSTGDKTHSSSIENSPKRRLKSSRRNKGSETKLLTTKRLTVENHKERIRPKSWAPSNDEIPFMLLTSDSEKIEKISAYNEDMQEQNYTSTEECDRKDLKKLKSSEWVMPNYGYSPIAGDLATTTLEPLDIQTDIIELPIITSTSQLSPMPDITSFLNETPISPLPTPKPLLNSINSLGSCDGDEAKKFDVNDDGVTNQYFERVNSVERPTNLDLYFSFNNDDSLGESYKIAKEELTNDYMMETSLDSKSPSKDNQRPDLLIDHPRNSPIEQADESDNSQNFGSIKNDTNQFIFDPIAILGERDNNIPGENLDDLICKEPPVEVEEPLKSPVKSNSYLSRAAQKRRDPRRLTLTRSTTMEIEERFQALEKHLSTEISTQSNRASLTGEENISYKQQSSPRDPYAETRSSTLDKFPSFEILSTEILQEPLEEQTRLSTKPPIPSTTDLEERYERQMSASDKLDKNDVRLSNSSSKSDQRDDSGSPKKETNSREARDTELKKEIETSTKKGENSQDHKTAEKSTSSPKKMPTTAELEKRFDALEVKTDVERTSPTKQNKEPPDIESRAKAVKSEASDNQPINDSDKSKEKCKEKHEIPEDKPLPAKKKTPPSTEELEKRFHALEKQMSTSTVASDSHKHEESSHPKTTTPLKKPSEEKTSDSRRPSEDKYKEESTKFKDLLNERELGMKSSNKDDIQEKQKGDKSGRRASEPPSTEDLEKRYETLKRRMSTRTSSERASYSETIDEALRRIEKIILSENNDNETREASDSSHLTTISENEIKIKSDARKEVLEGQRKENVSQTKSLTNQENQLSKGKDEQKNVELPREECVIPSPPPLPPSNREEKLHRNIAVSGERQALIEELQSKIDSISNEETFKPSSINPNRKTTPARQLEQSSLKNDEISEAHALTAFLRSGINEPWHGYTPRVVRRFSDLASRADLENRLEFLEQKFYKKLYKQRCASDSEVASRKHLIDESPKPSSSAACANTKMEQRLQALEKQLSENSLKLLEAMRAKAQDNDGASESPRRLSADTLDGTGKELVRYTHVGELEESGILKPINISINIKMTVDKSTETKIEKEPLVSSDLERRLEALEHQLKESRMTKTSAQEKSPLKEPANESRNHSDLGKTETVGNEQKEYKTNLPESKLSERKESQTFEAEHIKSKPQKSESQKTPKTQRAENQNVDTPKSEQQKEESRKGEPQKPQPQNLQPQNVEKKDQKSDHENENFNPKMYSDAKNEQGDTVRKRAKESNKLEHLESDSQEISEKFRESNSRKHDQEECIKNIETEESRSREREERKTEESVKDTQEKNGICKKESMSEKKKSESEKLDKVEKAQSESKKAPPSHQGHKEVETAQTEKIREDPKGVIESTPPAKPANEKLASETIPKETEIMKTPSIESVSTEQGHYNEETIVPVQTLSDKLIVNASEIGAVDANKKTLVLLLDNEPKAVKVRRLTRANTEELEGLFQALEKQLQERNLVKSDDGTLKHADDKIEVKESTNEAKAISELTKEIKEFTHAEKGDSKKATEPEEEQPYDWGANPVKRHLKRKTAHLPSTKELEARFRSLERQIKLLEDVEKIDVEQRLHEIERKIKLQYSLANEKDLTKYLELCEGKGLDDEPFSTPTAKTEEARCECGRRTPSKEKQQKPKTSPVSKMERSSSRSPSRKSTAQSSSPPLTPPPVKTCIKERDRLSRERSVIKKKSAEQKTQPIHPLEMLLDPSPDDSKIPTTGELEHRMRELDRKHRTPTPPRKSRSKSPAADNSRKRTPTEEKIYTKQPLHSYKKYDITPEKPEPPTAEELEARMRALEEDHIFDPKTQRNFKEFNEKLKNVISPSVSFEESKIDHLRDVSPRHGTDSYRSPTPKSSFHRSDADAIKPRSTSPKVIRFSDEDDCPRSSRSYRDISSEQPRSVGSSYGVLNTIEENSKILHRILKKTLAEPKEGRPTSYDSTITSLTSEGLDEMGSRLMRQTSPLRRTGTHTGVPLRTDDNINERLSSIKDTIKSIDSLCEEKPYRKEKCQRYIDSLFSDSTYFAQKKTSLEELRSRSASRSRHADYTPSIHVSDLSQRPSEYYLNRSIGSAESIRTTSPLRAASPLHYRSNRELARNSDVSPARRGRRYDEDREEYESRVRRDYMLPSSFLDNHSNLRSSGNSLTKFYKVDSQLDSYERDKSRSHSPRSRSPTLKSSTYDLRDTITLHNSQNSYTALNTQSKTYDLDKPTSPYRQTTHNLLTADYTKRLNNPPQVYSPSKLEIRHTTVTSTFYDRLLTEKQLEKSRTPSRSPVQTTSTTTSKTSTTTTTTTTATLTATTSIVGKSYLDTTTKIGTNSYNFLSSLSPTYTVQTTLHQNTNTLTKPITSITTAMTTAGNSDCYSHSHKLLCSTLRNTTINSDLRIRSCDNIIMQLNSNSVTTAALTGSIVIPTTTTTTTTTVTATTYSMTPFSMNSTLSSSYLNNTNSTISATITTTTSTFSEPNSLAPTGSRSSYLNLLSSTPSFSTTSSSVVSTTSYTSSFLASISDKFTTDASPSSTISTLSTVRPLSSTLPSSYTPAASISASYPSVSLPFQSSSISSNILGLYSSSALKTAEPFISTTK